MTIQKISVEWMNEWMLKILPINKIEAKFHLLIQHSLIF
jgi:hypothetical protein